MKKYMLIIAAAAAAFCSCSKEIDGASGNEMTFTAVSAATKVAIDVDSNKGAQTWEEGDVITVMDSKGASATATLGASDINGATATFKVSGLGAGPYSAFAGAATLSGSKLVFSPAAGKAFLCVAATSDRTLAFKNVFNLIAFKAGEDAATATLAASTNCAITAGTELDVDFAAGTLTTTANAKSISVPVVAGEINFIPVCPGSTLAGFSVKTYDASSAEVGSASTTKTLDFSARNKIAYIGEIKAAETPKDPAATFSTDNSGIECAFGRTISVAFNAAGAWTASVKEAGAGSVTQASGAAGNATVGLSLNANSGARRTVTLVISSPGYADAEIAFTQERKADYEVVFRKYPDAYSKDNSYRTWTNANTLFTVKVATVFGTYTLTNGGIQLAFGAYPASATSNFQYNETGFLFGNAGSSPDYTSRGGHITFPAIAGKKLTKVEVFAGAATSNQLFKAKIATDKDGSVIISGGEQKISAVNSRAAGRSAIASINDEMTVDYGSYLCWNLSGTEVNTPYTMMVAARTVIRWFTLYYE